METIYVLQVDNKTFWVGRFVVFVAILATKPIPLSRNIDKAYVFKSSGYTLYRWREEATSSKLKKHGSDNETC